MGLNEHSFHDKGPRPRRTSKELNEHHRSIRNKENAMTSRFIDQDFKNKISIILRVMDTTRNKNSDYMNKEIDVQMYAIEHKMLPNLMVIWKEITKNNTNFADSPEDIKTAMKVLDTLIEYTVQLEKRISINKMSSLESMINEIEVFKTELMT